MRILLDTCEFLWLAAGDVRLSTQLALAVRDPQNEVYLSAVSFWANFRCPVERRREFQPRTNAEEHG